MGMITSWEITELQPKRYELFTDMVAASIPATTIPRMPGPRIVASIAGIASIGASVLPLTTGEGTPPVSAPVPKIVNAAIPHNIGNVPRPRKINPVQVITRFDVSGFLVENMRIAVVCQQVCTENQSRVCQIRNVKPNF